MKRRDRRDAIRLARKKIHKLFSIDKIQREDGLVHPALGMDLTGAVEVVSLLESKGFEKSQAHMVVREIISSFVQREEKIAIKETGAGFMTKAEARNLGLY